MTVKCPHCRFENPDTLKYCGECGARLPPSSENVPATFAETLQTPVQELATGMTFAGRYQVIEELGRGGMGKVYKVFDTKIREKVALKLIKPEVASDRDTIERFANEIRLARRIGHRNVCRMFDLGEAEGAHFITMEYVHGEDLKSMIRMAAGLSVGAVLSIGKQISDGLVEAHGLGVVHRDLKPQNIMIDKGGNAKIMDFGIARSVREKGITGPGVLIGTPEYMSPEQAEAREADHRSDIYSLGILLYEMATGRAPFEGETALSVAMKHKAETPKDPRKLNPGIPAALSAVILKCLEKDRAKRYQGAAEVHAELEKIEKGIPTTERVVPGRKPITSREITVKFNLRKLVAPALLIAVVVSVALAFRLVTAKKRSPSAPAAKSSIAVLPFEDLSPAKANEALCDGLSGTLIDALTHIEGLRVPAQTSAFSFKGKTRDIREIGRKLAVDHVLEGTVQVDGDHLRITARISNVRENRQMWSQIYNRKLADLFSIQDDIARAIVTALKVKLLGEKGAPLVKSYTQDPEAYRLYLLGRSLWNKRSKADVVKSIEYFEKAVEIDPNDALAYAGLGDAYEVLGSNGFWLPEKAFPKARAAAMKALEIDDKLAEAHVTLAGIMGDYDWDFVHAEKTFKLAIELNPGYAIAHQWYAEVLSHLGRHEEAIQEIKIARNLDPLSPRISASVGFFLIFMGRYDEARAELNKALEADPNHFLTHELLGWVYEATGKYEDAVKCYHRAIELSGGSRDPEADLASCYASMGKREEARIILDDLVAFSEGNFISGVALAFICATLGEKDQAFRWLEKSFRERDPYLLNIKSYFRFDPLRSDPRFSSLVKRIGL